MAENEKYQRFRISILEKTEHDRKINSFDKKDNDSVAGVITDFIEYISGNFPKEFMESVSRLRKIQRERRK